MVSSLSVKLAKMMVLFPERVLMRMLLGSVLGWLSRSTAVMSLIGITTQTRSVSWGGREGGGGGREGGGIGKKET